MAFQLSDGSQVQPGSHLGALPIIADQRLAKPSTLLSGSTNPGMDLVLLITKDEASASSAAVAGPKGMSAAQRALMQRMMAKRAGQAAGPATAPEARRGPKIGIELWRLGEDSSCVLQMPISVEKLLDPEPGSAAAQANEQEIEDICLHDVCFSPNGERLAALLSVRRLKAASSSDPASQKGRFVTLVKTFSAHDGRLLSTTPLTDVQDIRQPSDLELFRQPQQLSWQLADTFAASTEARSAGAEMQLTSFDPLPALPSADQYASGSSSSGNLMPHQLRMMQMSGMQKTQATFELPSSVRAQGRGPLASFPAFSKSGEELALVERSGGAGKGGQDRHRDRNRIPSEGGATLDLAARTVIIVSSAATSQISLLLDGTVLLGSLSIAGLSDDPEGSGAHVSIAAGVCEPNLSSLVSIFASPSAAQQTSGVVARTARVALPIAQDGKSHRFSGAHRATKLSRLSHILSIYAGHALDVAAIVEQIWKKEVQEGLIDEWIKQAKEMQNKFGCDAKYEMLVLLLTGKASAAVETLLFATLTEGVLSRFEQTAFIALGKLKQLLYTGLRPALERILICLQEWLGLRLYAHPDEVSQMRNGKEDLPHASATAIRGHIRTIQACLDATLSLTELIELEAVTFQEFIRFCRHERDRQEHLKQERQEPRTAIAFDVYTVARYIERGFEPLEIKRIILGLPDAEPVDAAMQDASLPPADEDESGDEVDDVACLSATLALARSHLDQAGGANLAQDRIGPSVESTRTSVLIASGLLKTLSGVVTQMGVGLRSILASSLDDVILGPIQPTDGERVLREEPGDKEMLSNKTALTTTTTVCAAAESLVEGTPSSDPPRAVKVSSQLVWIEGEKGAEKHFVALLPHSAERGVELIDWNLTASTVRRWSLSLPPPLDGAGDAPTTVIDFAIFDAHESVLLLQSGGEEEEGRGRYIATFRHDLFCLSTPSDGGGGGVEEAQMALERITELEPGFEAQTMAVSGHRKTAAVLSAKGERIVYLDLARGEGE